VLALAAGLDPTPAGQDLPSPLHDYLAEEVFRACNETLRGQLLQLPLLPNLSARRLLREFGELWTAVVDEARGCGFLSGETPPELHPLLREFLMSKLRETADSAQPAAEAVEECLSCGNWDQALDLIQRFELLHLARPALERAYLPLVRSARLGTLARIAAELRRTESKVSLEAELVDAEVALRDGEYRLAVQIARRFRGRVPQKHTLLSRAGAIEGSATTQLADFDASERAFEVALEHAEDSVDLAEAIHGLALAAIYGERESADRRLSDLGAHAKSTCAPLDIARHAASAVARMRLGEGFVDSPYVEDALRSLPYVEDPRARTSVLYTLTYVLSLQMELGRAIDVGRRMLADVEEFGLGFARPHAMWNLAFAELALRRFGEADRHLKFVEQEVERQPLGHHVLNARVLRSRFLMQLARPEEAYAAVRRPVNDAATPAMHAEYIATRALALSLLGRDDDAIETAAVASSSSIATEVQVQTTGVQAIVAARAGDPESAVRLMTVARQRRTWEPVICCLRSSSALASCLSEHDDARPDLEWLYQRSNDLGLARRAGFRVKTSKRPAALLSPRELEVLSLMAQGYRNRDIAQAFVISESTVKVHVRHILEKLGVRSRTQAVAQFHEL
jgi:DNA-binding NarL/FixJ family response regulator